MIRPSTVPDTTERPPEVARAIAWLQAEQNAAESPAYSSMLLHESAVILQSAGDTSGAHRSYRAALSLESHFLEPLEGLIELAERQSSLSELAELLRRLSESTTDPHDRCRALISLSMLELERNADLESAKTLLREAAKLNQADATPWVVLELIGQRTSDPVLREEALLARLELAQTPTLRCLLLIDLAELLAMANDATAACSRLDEAIALRTTYCYPALVHKTRLATKAALPSELDQALLTRLRLLEDTSTEPVVAATLGIPNEEREPVVQAYLHLLRSFALRTLGQTTAASVELGAARAELPQDRVLLLLNLAEAEERSDKERFLSAGQALAPLLKGNEAAWCWTKLAAARLASGDDSAAAHCVEQGLEQTPQSLSLHALRVYLAFRSSNGLRLASALEAATACFAANASRATWLLATAGIWARSAHSAETAKSAMAQTAMQGLPEEECHQVGRLLALWVSDLDYYDESTFGALTKTTARLDRLDLGLELLRHRLSQAKTHSVEEGLSELLRSDDSAFVGHLAQLTLGRWLRRTAQASSESITKSESASWDYLADRCDSATLAQSLRCVAAVSELAAGRVEAATKRLSALAESDPSNLTVAMARVTLAIRENAGALAARILRSTAFATAEPALRSTIALYGAILVVSLDTEQDDLTALLDLAASTHPHSAAVLSRWVLRTATTKTPELQRRIQSAADPLGSPVRRMLERWGMEFSLTACPPQLATLAMSPDNGLGSDTPFSQQYGAFALLELLQDNRMRLVDERELPTELGSALAALHAGLKYAETWLQDSPAADTEQRLVDARAWAQIDSSLLAQLEWFLVARQSGEFTDEAGARASIASILNGKEAESLSVGVQQLHYLMGDEYPALLPSTSAAARFANLEMSPPGSDPRRRATALAESADLQGPSSTLLMRTNLAFNFIACGDYGQAQTTFTELVEARPNFLPAWLGLRTVAELTGNRALLARACASVGDLLSSPRLASEQWERAATLLFDELNDPERGRLALERATACDITRDTSFTRLFRLVREAREQERLLALIDARLPHAKDDEERILLLWERARTLRTLNDRQGALLALDAVTHLAPNHVGALALAGEIHIALGQFDDAARFLAQLGRLESAPLKQRLMGALAAADLFDKKLGHPVFARDILLHLYREGHAPIQLKERLASVATKTQAYELGIEVLESLLSERDTPGGRMDAARLAMALCRDKLKRPERAAFAVERLLEVQPLDAEALELVLSGCFDRGKSDSWLQRSQTHLRDELQRSPLDAALLENLAQIAAWFDDVRTREVCLGALIAVGAGTEEQDAEIAELDERIRAVPTIAIDDIVLEAISDAEDQGPLAALFAQFAPVFAEALGPSIGALGVGKKQRVDPRAGLPLRNEIAAWAGTFGVSEFDLYLAPQLDGDIISIPAERPIVVASTSLSTPLDLRGRQAVARELFALRRGTSLLRSRSVSEIAALIVAACQVGEHPLEAPAYAMKDEFVRLVSDALPRKQRKALSELAAAIQSSNVDLTAWIQAATHSLDRVAALSAGDISHVLAHLTGQRGRLGTSRELRDRTARLVAFVVSPTYLELKDTLGLNVR